MSFLVYKEIGETTGELSTRVKAQYNFDKVAVCGKLDPMARGITRVLANENTKLMNTYLSQTKVYEFYLVMNIKTDTDDIMGIIQKESDELVKKNDIIDFIHQLKYDTEQQFHPYSAIKLNINGERQSLHYWANKGLLTDENIPTKNITVNDIDIGNWTEYSPTEYLNEVHSRLDTISPSFSETFRIPEIKQKWNNIQTSKIHMLKIKMSVSSGYYIRMIPRKLFKTLGICSHIYDIHRIHT